MKNILTELKKRQVFKVATIYVVSAWPLIQIADIVAPALGLPDSILQLLLTIFIIGFPISLIFAWLIDFTPQGMVLAGTGSDPDPAAQGGYKVNVRAVVTVAGSLVLAVIVTLGGQLMFESSGAGKQAENTTTTTPQPPALLSASDKQSIAILPFVAFSGDPADEFFVDGMVEELLNLLANVPDLQVAARTSSFSYKGVTDKTIVEIGKELGVDFVLEGSLRKNDVSNQIRVTAQLVRIDGDEHLWSETYEKEYLDIFQIQDDIAHAVVDKMKHTLLGESSPEVVFDVGTDSVDAMVEYGKGQKELGHRTAPSIQKALQHFSAAVAADENYARAYVGLSDAHILLALYGSVPKELAKESAQQALDTALRLNPELGSAHASQGLLHAELNKLAAAESSYKRAIELNPNYAMTYMWYGSLRQNQGDLAAAQMLFEKALELDPKSPVAAYNVAHSHYQLGEEDKAMEFFSKIIANDPYYPGAYLLVGEILRDRGRLDEAIDMFRRALRVDSVNKSAVSGLLIASMDLEAYSLTDQWFEYLETNPSIMTANEQSFLRARYFAAKGELEKATQVFQQVQFNTGDEKTRLLVEGEIAFYQQKYAAAASAYTALREITKDNKNMFFHISNGDAATHLAYSYRQLNQHRQASELLLQYDLYLQSNVAKKANRPEYYYNMAQLNALRDDESAAFDYLQGAIDAGFVQIWRANLEPIFAKMASNARFGLMMGGVNARLTNMRARMKDRQAPSLAEG